MADEPVNDTSATPPASGQQARTLRLTIEVPDYWADDLEDRAGIWRDTTTPSSDDVLDMFVEEEMADKVILVGTVLSQGEDPDEMRAFECRIVGVTSREGRSTWRI